MEPTDRTQVQEPQLHWSQQGYGGSVQERNERYRVGLQIKWAENQRRHFRESLGIDIGNVKAFPFGDPMFDWARFYKEGPRIVQSRRREADTSSTQGALLRAGVQISANGWYLRTPVTYTKVAHMATSDKSDEWYAPVNRAESMLLTQANEPIQESRLDGVHIRIHNYKYARMISIERELFEDDQSSQIAERPQSLGEGAAITEEAWFWQRVIGTSGTSPAGDVIPATETTPSDETNGWPYSTGFVAGTVTGVTNRLSTYHYVSYANIRTLWQGGRRMRDKLGNIMGVYYDFLWSSTDDEIDIIQLLKSPQYPAGAQAAGVTGGAFAINPLAQLDVSLKPVFTPYLPSRAWGLCQAGKGLAFQARTAVEFLQESKDAGASFSNDAYRFRARRRWGVDWIDGRFWAAGNDGTATN